MSTVTLLLLLTAPLLQAVPGPGDGIIISGAVTDRNQLPVVGASVTVIENDKIIFGTSADTDGSFKIKIKTNDKSLTLRVSSIGFFGKTEDIAIDSNRVEMNFTLEQQTIEIGSIAVNPEKIPTTSERIYDSKRISNISRQALIPTNPIAALKEPEISRQGSNHSSQIRINGTNPKYYLNGTLLGADPDHYGMFSVIPASIIDEIKFYPQGASAERAQASSIDLNTPAPYYDHSDICLDLSTVEATGMYSLGNENFYIFGSVRKSLLDKLVKSFDISSDRRTIPPTNFEDIYLSMGVKLSSRYRLMLDHYSVRDYLAYNTGSAVSASDIDTYQRTNEYLTSLRLDAVYDKLLIKFNGAFRNGRKIYNAAPGDNADPSKIHIDLNESRKTGTAALTGIYMSGNWEIRAGNQLEYVSSRDISLSQKNWNFLSPFYSSDNPYIYQQALNEIYGAYEGLTTEINNAAYVSASKEIGRFKFENGLRLEYFNHLQNNRQLLSRHTLTFKTSARSRIELHYGTYAESPSGNILEPYQVLVQDNLDNLQPVTTRQYTAGWANDNIEINLFKKDIDYMAVITPDFDNVYADDGGISDNFLTMQVGWARRAFTAARSVSRKRNS